MTSFPPPPINTLDWSTIGFKCTEVNGHIESRWTAETGKWSEPEFVRDPYVRVHGMSPALNYGQQAFEGIKAYRLGNGDIAIFRPDQNAARMAHSCATVSIPEIPAAHFERCVNLAVALNAEYVPPTETGQALYIRPVAYGLGAQLPLAPPVEYLFTTFVMPTGTYHGAKPVSAVIVEQFDRAAPRGTGTAKLGGNYAPVMRWSERAYKAGYGITLHLDSTTRSEIDEFSTSGFMGVRKDKADGKWVLAVPDSSAVIKSVTSTSVCDLARHLGWLVEKRRIAYADLAEFDEVFAAGTAAALVPVKSITHESDNKTFEFAGMDGEPGPAYTELFNTFKAMQRGKIENPFGWLQLAKDPKDFLAGQDVHQTNGTNGHAEIKSVNQLE